MNPEKKQQKHESNLIVPIVLLASILMIALLGTVLGWRFTVQKMEAALKEQVEKQVEILQDEITRQFAVLEGYGSSFTRENINDHEQLLEKLNRCVTKTEYTLACFVYPDGTLYRNDGVKTDVSHRFYFQEGMQGRATIEFLADSKIDEEEKVGLAIPIWLNGKIEGVLLGLYDKEKFDVFFESTFTGSGNMYSICDSSGRFLIGTKTTMETLERYRSQTGKDANFFDILDESVFSVSSGEQVRKQMENSQGGQAAYTFRGEKRYTTYIPLRINGWYLIAMMYENQIYEDALGIAGIFYAMIFLIMVAVLVSIVYLLRREHKMALAEMQKREEIKYQFEHDALTDVLTEKAFLEQVNERLPELRPDEYCLLYLDIYKFKLINETFGYNKGDELLCATADGLKALVKRYDGLCGRISGDSFVLLLPHKEEIIKEFDNKKYQKKRIVPLDLYIHYGVYVIKDTEIPADQMVDCAKIAQKTVKGNYNNCIAYYDEQIKEKLIKEQEIVTSMSSALSDGEFIVYLQPQYNYRDGTICGAEALVRWKSPVKGMISPGDFIPIFETNGFIISLDEYVWEQVCKLQCRWMKEGRTIVPISVNVSRADLLKGEIARKLMSLIETYGLTPDMLRVEITESAYMDNPQQLVMEISKMKECGLIVEMDDFGTGYSSLNMLKDVPIQVLKTDLKFLSASGIDSRKEQILNGVIRMAHEMGMFVIAEGVETKEQADYLLSLNCTQMQGYYFSRPIPVEEYEKLVYG